MDANYLIISKAADISNVKNQSKHRLVDNDSNIIEGSNS